MGYSGIFLVTLVGALGEGWAWRKRDTLGGFRLRWWRLGLLGTLASSLGLGSLLVMPWALPLGALCLSLVLMLAGSLGVLADRRPALP